MTRRLGTLAALAALAGAPLLRAASSEVYGRPLRGLSPTPIAEVAADPERHRGRPLHVSGTVAEGSAGRIVVTEGSASLSIESDGSFAPPKAPKGARVTAEGKLAPGAVTLIATGLEISR